jgi:hypothetical protein
MRNIPNQFNQFQTPFMAPFGGLGFGPQPFNMPLQPQFGSPYFTTDPHPDTIQKPDMTIT